MCRVLIIEDDWLTADYLAGLVAQAGATSIATAGTEDEAIESAQRSLPGIILSDVNLIVGTGPHAVQMIQSAHGNIPVIFITASPEACRPCAPPGVVLIKPVDAARLIEMFRRMAPCRDTAATD